jgi:LuxR family maltose regulon positive regulatory protein
VVETTATRPFEVIEAKISPPHVRSGTVSRTALVNRLRTARWTPVTIVCAPAGYGKTTVLAQWSVRDPRPFAWVSTDERDNDPLVLLRNIAAALDTVQPLERDVLDALRSPGGSIWISALPRLGASVRSIRTPFVLVIDDSHLVRSRDSLRALATLAEHVPRGSRLVLAGRATPRLPIAALRARGLLFEVGPEDLALSRREAQLLLQETGVIPTSHDMTDLVTRCEGWAAALYLACLSLRDTGATPRPSERVRTFRGDDKYLADYVRSEYLSRLRPGALRFLRRTSVLDRMCGPLCDAVLAEEGSARELEKIERDNLFLLPLDHHRGWYRYHGLFRDLLRRALAEAEPELVPILERRAAEWYEANGDLESALEQASAGGDLERAARLLTAIALPVYSGGRATTVEAWLERFDQPALLQRFPGVALQGAWVHALRGRAVQAERWLCAAEKGTFEGRLADGCTSLGPWIAVLRAAMCRDGVDQMLVDGERAVARLPAESFIRPFALLVHGAARLLSGDPDRADGVFAEAVDAAQRSGATDTQILAFSERSLIAFGRGDAPAAEAFAAEVRDLVERSELFTYVTSGIALAVSARALLRHGNWAEARSELAKAEGLGPSPGPTPFPWLAVQTRLELARVYLALRDGPAARALVAELSDPRRFQPHLGVLADCAASLQEEAETLSDETTPHAAGLTGAELRLLPLLATHLSFAEIGTRLYVSRNTIKTQAISIYRRLGVSSRSDAIAEADRLGLVDLTTVPSGTLVLGGP